MHPLANFFLENFHNFWLMVKSHEFTLFIRGIFLSLSGGGKNSKKCFAWNVPKHKVKPKNSRNSTFFSKIKISPCPKMANSACLFAVQDSCKISCVLQEFLAQAKFLQEAYHIITKSKSVWLSQSVTTLVICRKQQAPKKTFSTVTSNSGRASLKYLENVWHFNALFMWRCK